MYSSKPSYVFGFHGLDKDIAFDILTQKKEFKHSSNDHDWLANGVYFWENNLERAKQYAIEDMSRKDSKIKTPFVLGAIIDLGNCLDLLDQKNLDLLKIAYEELKKDLKQQKLPLPQNTSFGKSDFDFKRRELDCAVIRYAHKLANEHGVYFDSVRAAFIEGEEIYKNAGFKIQNHIQIAIINPNCIKGIFLPREKVKFPK
jgi:hypothetical protein